MEPLVDIAGRWRGRHVLVIGDALLDGWLEGIPSRLSREAPVPVVTVNRVTYSPGGAANTAANLAALGARAALVTTLGPDRDGQRVDRCLRDAGVRTRWVCLADRATPARRRVVADGQILLRYDTGVATGPPSAEAVARLTEAAGAALAGTVDGVVVVDHGLGTAVALRDWLVARRGDIPVLVVDAFDPAPWHVARPDLVTPDFAEALRLLRQLDGAAVHDQAAWASSHGLELREASGAQTVAVTLGGEGAVVVGRDGGSHRTRAREVVTSAIGAGDAYAAAFALALIAGTDPADAAAVAQHAAGVAVRRSGTAVCGLDELLGTPVERPNGDGHGTVPVDQGVVVDIVELVRRVSAHRRAGARIVFTNGCFDVLHPGHVRCLRQARALGDILVVAINSDESVRRLKGEGRPVNPEADRAAMLAALSFVDHVVVFGADTPVELIERLRPDVYVKGGDYRAELLAETEVVRRLGGEVHILDYVPDRSTSQIIERIRAGQAARAAPT